MFTLSKKYTKIINNFQIHNLKLLIINNNNQICSHNINNLIKITQVDKIIVSLFKMSKKIYLIHIINTPMINLLNNQIIFILKNN